MHQQMQECQLWILILICGVCSVLMGTLKSSLAHLLYSYQTYHQMCCAFGQALQMKPISFTYPMFLIITYYDFLNDASGNLEATVEIFQYICVLSLDILAYMFCKTALSLFLASILSILLEMRSLTNHHCQSLVG